TNLRPEIRTRLEPFPITTLIEAYGIAQRIEATLTGDRGTTGGYKGKGTDRKIKKGRWQGQGSQSSGSSDSFISTESEHFTLYSYHYCGQRGNFRRNCPQFLQTLSPTTRGPQGSQATSMPIPSQQTRPAHFQSSALTFNSPVQHQYHP
ncbi:hypothetical protein PanWU01x14_369340, partial [Parasponia andersonii]